MNRREALSALPASLAIGQIEVAQVSRTDVFVIEAPGNISDETAQAIAARIEKYLGGNCIVLGSGMKLSVLRSV